jgi:hypothetical protein
MPKYITDVDRWISHECRMVKAGEEFDTEFPKAPDGKPMRLGDTLREIVREVVPPKKGHKPEPGESLT